MPKIAKELTAVEVRRISHAGKHAVGGVPGLLLQCGEHNARSWVLRTKVGARRREIGLGPFPEVTLADARAAAREIRAKIRDGIDPVQERRAARAALVAAEAKSIKFREAAEKFLAMKKNEFRNSKHRQQWTATLETYAFPVIGNLPVDAVGLPHIVAVLQPLWIEKTVTATRLRGRIEAVLSWATVSGFRSGDNPARWRGNLDQILPKPQKIKNVNHHKAIPWREIGAFMPKLRATEGIPARALEFAILTAARSGEVRGAKWSEIDFERKIWTVPSDRMKAGKEHRVPLADDAIDLLQKLPRVADVDYVFPAPMGGELSDTPLGNVLKRLGVVATVHGFRSTFRDWTAESTGYPTEMAEMALAHAVGNRVEQAYRRGDLLEKRFRLMRDWAEYVSREPRAGDVVAIRGGSGNGD